MVLPVSGWHHGPFFLPAFLLSFVVFAILSPAELKSGRPATNKTRSIFVLCTTSSSIIIHPGDLGSRLILISQMENFGERMTMTSRRKFIASIPRLGAAVALGQHISPAQAWAESCKSAPAMRIPLENGWSFCFDQSASRDPQRVLSDLSNWQTVTVPHTWQALGGSPNYVGVAWYRLDVNAWAEWKNQFVRIEFEAIFHTADVFLNGAAVGQHIGRGYTAFTCDLSPGLRYGLSNTLLVRVDNSYSDTMLPRLKSYDWANDGGIIRPVSLLITSRVFLERLEIDASPNLSSNSARVAIRAIVRNTFDTPQTAQVRALLQEEGSGIRLPESEPASSIIPASSSKVVALPATQLKSPQLWHFDFPNLYTAAVTLTSGETSSLLEDTFGIRCFETRGSQFYLNGEPVVLMGVERMAGSHPEFGMAEPDAWIEANHRDMKELNCVFTRVHWPQDRRVLDYCDRHGILMQEEVPAWGSDTFLGITDQLQRELEQNGLEQLQEMIARDRNHPCIGSWGLCNEVDGKNPRSRAFAHALADEARKLDPSRLLTYASNSLAEEPEADMAGDFDFISANEYFGSWSPGGTKEAHDYIDRIRKAFPGKPIVISEYGWCECQPSIPPGDEHRVNIVTSHTQVFRDFLEVAGAIYFDYNDYRTLVGDQGVGALRQRVHGVVDLYANRKPSFQVLQLEASPIERLDLKKSSSGYHLFITSRKTLPAYALKRYRLRWVLYGYDDLPMEGRMEELATLLPGMSVMLTATFNQTKPKRIVVDILRPTGFSAATAELRVSE
jgi:beta-galactosidase